MKYTLFPLLGFVLLAGTAVAQNELTNPGFESGTTGWTICGDARLTCAFHGPNAHSGADALCAEGCCGAWSNASGGVQTASGLSAGLTYDVWGWVKGSCDDGPPAVVGMGGSCGSSPTTVFGSSIICTYAQFATTVSGVTSITFNFYSNAHPGWAAASVHWDDAYVAAQAVDDWVLY